MHSLQNQPDTSQQSSCVWFSKGGTDSIMQHACTHTYNRYRRWVFLAFFLSSVQYWLSFQFIVMPLLLSLLASCRSLWGMCMHLKGLAERKKKVTKESMSICYSLSAVLLILQTPHDGFLVNVKRAGATDWLLWHAQKAFSRGYLHSFHPGAVKCVLYYVALAVCVCVHRGWWWEGSCSV